MRNRPPEAREGYMMFEFQEWCAAGGHPLDGTPCMFLYKPKSDSWDAVCRECCIWIIHNAAERMELAFRSEGDQYSEPAEDERPAF
jgi:hypothetical protein